MNEYQILALLYVGFVVAYCFSMIWADNNGFKRDKPNPNFLKYYNVPLGDIGTNSQKRQWEANKNKVPPSVGSEGAPNSKRINNPSSS